MQLITIVTFSGPPINIEYMSNYNQQKKSEFNKIIQLIKEARDRAFSKVNAELVLLYFNVGKIVSAKVVDGAWGDGTVDELANYVAVTMPGLSGFNRRGFYRMKQFYETYSVELLYLHWRQSCKSI